MLLRAAGREQPPSLNRAALSGLWNTESCFHCSVGRGVDAHGHSDTYGMITSILHSAFKMNIYTHLQSLYSLYPPPPSLLLRYKTAKISCKLPSSEAQVRPQCLQSFSVILFC